MIAKAVALALTLSTAPAPKQPVPDLVRVATTRFAPSLEGVQAGYGNVATHPDRPLAYAWSYESLFVIDTGTGEIVETVDLSSVFTETLYAGGHLELAGHGAGSRLLLSGTSGHRGVEVYSLADPIHPVRESTLGTAARSGALVLPGGHAAVVTGYPSPILYDLDTASVRGTFPGASGAAAAGGAEGAAIAAFVVRHAADTSSDLLLFDVPSAGSPEPLATATLPASPRTWLVDRRGEIVVLAYDEFAGGRRTSRIEVRDARSGALRSAFPLDRQLGAATLAEGGAARVLAVADGAGLDLVDLVDPAAPASHGSVTSRLGYEAYAQVDPANALAPSAREPLLFVASAGDRAILAVDLRDGAVVARASAEGLPVGSLFLREGDISREAVALAYHTEGFETFVAGGTRELQVHDLSDIDAPTVRGRLIRSQPRSIDGFVKVGSDHAVAVDSTTNAYALVAVKQGRVLQLTGTPGRVYKPSEGDTSVWLRSAGRYVVAEGDGGWAEFALEAGRLVPVAGIGDFRGAVYTAADVHESGRVSLLGQDLGGSFLEVHDPDGRGGRVPLVLGFYDHVSLSPDGRLALVVVLLLDRSAPSVTCVDVSEPERPTILWTGNPETATATFDPSSTSVLLTGPEFSGSFTFQRFDARSGVPLAPESESIGEFFYHGVGTAYGDGAGRRLVLWRWTWAGWETLLVDAGASTPRLLHVYPEILDGFPFYAPRDTGGWYELVENPWDGYTRFAVADASGTQRQVLVDPVAHEFPVGFRRGLFATVARPNGPHPEVVLWLDTSLAPVRVPIRR